MLNTRAVYNNLMAIFLKLTHVCTTQRAYETSYPAQPCPTLERPLCARRCGQGWPRARSPRCHYLWFPVLSVRGRQSGDRWRGTRHRDGIQAPLRQLDTAVAGGGAWVTPAVVCPPTCSVVVRQQVGPGLGGWQGADAPLHPFAVPPPPFTPSQMPLRRSSPHLTAASQRTQALTDHFFFSPSHKRSSLMPKTTGKGSSGLSICFVFKWEGQTSR